MNVQKEYNIDSNAKSWSCIAIGKAVEAWFSSFCNCCEHVWSAHQHGLEYKVINHY